MTDDSKQLANGLADTLMRAAEEQVTKAQTMLDQTKALVEIIHTQMMAQAKASEDMNARFREVGNIMLDAHRILNGHTPDGMSRMVGHGADADRHTTLAGRQEVSDAARRGSFAGAGLPPNQPTANYGSIEHKRANDPRDPDTGDFARQQGGLPRPLADLDIFRVNRAGPGTDHRNPGTGSIGS